MRLTVKRPQDGRRRRRRRALPLAARRRRRRLPAAKSAVKRLRSMATKSRAVNVDLNSVFEGAASQFRGLNPNEPGQWPLLPKLR